MKEITCLICGKKKIVRNFAVGKYCSRKCLDKSNTKYETKKHVCKACSKEFIVSEKWNRKFCSLECAYSVRYKKDSPLKYRQRAFSLLGRICARCGYDEYPEVLEVHHLDHDRKNGDITNLNVFCPTCHAEIHFLDKHCKELRIKT